VIIMQLTEETLIEIIKLYELHIIKEKLKLFEKKYSKTFEEFEKEVLEKEDFEKWDDYLEWKAYLKTLKSLEKTG
jgi:hypothetical protein